MWAGLSCEVHAGYGCLFLPMVSLVHLHLTFSGLGGILSLWGQQEQCPFPARLRVLKLVAKTIYLLLPQPQAGCAFIMLHSAHNLLTHLGKNLTYRSQL